MSSKKLSAGDYIDSRCTRCRVITNHTIVAMVADRVVRVQCNTCGGMHNYHAPKAEKSERAKPPRRAEPAKTSKNTRSSRVSAVALEQEQWLAASRDADPASAVSYSMDATFQVDTWVNHPVFGFGLVLSVVPNKVEILFQEGKKLLRCNS